MAYLDSRYVPWPERISDAIKRPFQKANDAYYAIRNRFFYKYYMVDTGLKKTGWHDVDRRMLHACMELLVSYVEKEKCFETIVWDENDFSRQVAAEIKAIYAWWKAYPVRSAEPEKYLELWHNAYAIKNPTPQEKQVAKTLGDIRDELVAKLEREEEDMLIRLIKIRKSLWT